MKLPADKPEEYLSIDIETTALEPDQGQIIEFAAVIDNFCGQVNDKPVFRKLIMPEIGLIRGHAVALAMNAEIVAETRRIFGRTIFDIALSWGMISSWQPTTEYGAGSSQSPMKARARGR